MKIKIKQNQYYTTMNDMANVDSTTLPNQHYVYCDECKKVFALEKNAFDGSIKLIDGLGYWSTYPLYKLKDLIELSDTIEPDEIDISSIEKYHEIKSNRFDYYHSRMHMKDYVSGLVFNNLTNTEKELISYYCATDAATLIGYYMSYGLTINQATLKYKVRRAIDINNASKSCTERAESGIVFYIAIKYLSEQDSLQFKNAIHSYLQDYKEAAHLGTQYGVNADGIMDYIEATGSHVGAGLSIYTFNTGYTYEQCKEELRNYLIFGSVPTEYELYK